MLQNKDQLYDDFLIFIGTIFQKYGWFILLPLLLFPVNWALEAWKWKYLTQKIEKVSFLRSYRGILTGVAMGFATPMGLGDYAGRILQLNNPERAKGLGAVFISRISQFYITLVCGSASLIFIIYRVQQIDIFFNTIFLFFIIITNLIFLFLLLFHHRVLLILKEISVLKKVYPYVEIISQYSFRELLFVLALSLARYIVFSAQFVFILYFAGVSSRVDILLLGVNFIFLAKSVIPTLFDLWVRETAAVYFFSFFMIASDQVIFSSLSLWFINILMPAVLGLFLIFKLKLFTRP
ncbi:MAG: flippase-like domain-containing protein [Cytophagaceae bacterium]|nr:flippase-like domain-containing protein [Cytophagaceae bacterium]